MGDNKVSFFGLCYVRVNDKETPTEAYLPSEHGHVTSVAVDVDDLNVQASSDPDAIVYLGETQIACYNLAAAPNVAATVTLAGRGGTTWDKSNRQKSIHFALAHGNIQAKDSTDLDLNAVVMFKNGKFECGPNDKRVKVVDPNEKKKPIPKFVQWTADDDPLTIQIDETIKVGDKSTVKTRRITLKKTGLGKGRMATITNVATHKPDDTTLAAHFKVYYSLLKKAVPDPDQLHLIEESLRKRAKKGARRRRDRRDSVEVYDCVPPGTGS